MTPDFFRARVSSFLAWLQKRAPAYEVDSAQSAEVARLLRTSIDGRELLEWELRPLLRDLLALPEGPSERLLDMASDGSVSEFLVRNARRSLQDPVERLLAASGRDPLFSPRRSRWREARPIRYRYWSFWDGPEDDFGEPCQGQPVHMNLRFGPSGNEGDSAFAWIDFGGRLLDALERPGWETLRDDLLAVIGHRLVGWANLPEAPPEAKAAGAAQGAGRASPGETIQALRDYRRRMRDTYHFLPGLLEEVFLCGRLGALLGAAPAEAERYAPSHADDEIVDSIRLAVDDGEQVREVSAEFDGHGEPGLPSFSCWAQEEEADRRLLDALVDDLLAEPVLADFDSPAGVVVREGRITQLRED